MAGVGQGTVMTGLERGIGYMGSNPVAEQKNQKVDTHLLCSGYATSCSERWVS